MKNNEELVEVYVCIENGWIENFESDASQWPGIEVHEEDASWIPIIGAYSKSKYNELASSSGFPQNTTNVLAKINFDDLLESSVEGKGFNFKIYLEAEDGKLRKATPIQPRTPKARLK